MVSTTVGQLLLLLFFPITNQVGYFIILNHTWYQYLKSKPINYQFHSQKISIIINLLSLFLGNSSQLWIQVGFQIPTLRIVSYATQLG
jgi:hypothetical protein